MQGKKDLLRIFVAAVLSLGLVCAIVSASLKLKDGIIGTVISYKTERLIPYPSILVLPIDIAMLIRRDNKTLTDQYEELSSQHHVTSAWVRVGYYERKELPLNAGRMRTKYQTNTFSTTIYKYYVIDPGIEAPPSAGVRLGVVLNLTMLGRGDVLVKVFETGQQTMSNNR